MSTAAKPRRLRRGDFVSLVAPSGSASGPDRVEASVSALETLGFRVKASTHCADARGYLAGEDATRARELEAAFLDPETTAVICLKGGYGSPRILDLIDYSIVASHPKVFLGYSDITALHIAFRQMAGLVTFHGPMPSSDMVPEFDPASRASLESVLFGEFFAPCEVAPCEVAPPGQVAPVQVSPPAGKGPLSGKAAPPSEAPPSGPLRLHAVSGGIAEGELTGGNLSLIAATMGTPWEIDTEGKIIFIEDIDEAPYRVDRMLNQLRLAGKFRDCTGILVGAWTRCDPTGDRPSLTIEEIIADLLADCGKPILTGLEAGHCAPTLTLPLGIRYRMDAGACAVTMLESPFAD